MLYIIITIASIILFTIIFMILKSLLAPHKLTTISNFIKTGKYQAAIKSAKQLLIKDPSNSGLHYLLGQAYLKDGKPEIALMEFIRVNESGRFEGIIDEKVFRQTIAGLYVQFNHKEEALKEYLILAQKDPYNSNYQFTLATLFEERGKIDNAVTHYNKAIELDKRNDAAHFNLGKLYFNTKQLPQAKSSFEEAVKYNKENYNAHFFIGKVNKEGRNLVVAINSFDQAQKAPDLKVKSLIEKGICQMMSNSNELAIIELERAIRLVKEDSNTELLHARYFLALCYEKERKILNALEQWEIIYAKKPNFKDVEKKLHQYQEIRTDDTMKDFLTVDNEKFMDMCVKIIESKGFAKQEIAHIKGGCQILASDLASGKWRNIKPQTLLINFFRLSEPIDEPQMREFSESMKKAKMKGVIYSTSDFTRKALSYIETRPIDIVTKEEIQEILKAVNF